MNKNDIDLSDIIKKKDEIINLSIPDDFDKKKNIIKLYKLHQTMFLSKDKKRFENISNILLSSSVSELYGIDKINKEKLEKEKLKEEISSVIFHDGKITNHSDFFCYNNSIFKNKKLFNYIYLIDKNIINFFKGD